MSEQQIQKQNHISRNQTFKNDLASPTEKIKQNLFLLDKVDKLLNLSIIKHSYFLFINNNEFNILFSAFNDIK